MIQNKLFQKRLELLSKIGTIQISKNGNYYVITDSQVIEFIVDYSYNSITKSNIKLLGQTSNYKRTKDSMIMLTKDNKLKYKNSTDKNFSSLNIKAIRTFFSGNLRIVKLFFYNKKCEWVANYPKYISSFVDSYNLIKSFKSLRELLLFLGYRSKLTDITKITNLIAGYNFSNKENLIKAQLYEITDCIRMILTSNSEHYYTSNKSIHNIHEELVKELNKIKLESLSGDPIWPEYKLKVDSKLEKAKVPFKSLLSERSLAEEGMIQSHCIGAKSHLLSSNLFYSILYNEETYSLHCNAFQILEFRGSRNKVVPPELFNLIQQTFSY